LNRAKTFQAWKLALGTLAVTGAAVVLFLFEPTKVRFYPKCLFHQWTGLSCPGCGATRAMYSLLHGDVVTAFKFNPLLLILLPLLIWVFLRQVVRQTTGQILPSPFDYTYVGWAVAGGVIVFGVVRNLPFPAFAWMNH
jgi:hypothetical protein